MGDKFLTAVAVHIDADVAALNRVLSAAAKMGPWVSASLGDLKPGHDGAYERDANEFLDALHKWGGE